MALTYRLAQGVVGEYVQLHRLGLVPIRFASAAVTKKRAAPAAAAPAAASAAAAAPEKKKSMWDSFGVHYTPTRPMTPMPKDFKEFPERDIVNFPHPELKLWPEKVRLVFIPDSWFQFFYKKTGVTGPYLFGGGLIAFLLQKELIALDGGWKIIAPLTFCLYMIHGMTSAGVNKYMDQELCKDLDAEEKWRSDQVNGLKEAIKTEQYLQNCYKESIPFLFDAKRENVHLQLEVEYRDRVNRVYKEVKRRMDYLAESEEAKRRFEQRHMVQWIVDQVKKSITDQFEKNYLNQCIVDLKSMAKNTR